MELSEKSLADGRLQFNVNQNRPQDPLTQSEWTDNLTSRPFAGAGIRQTMQGTSACRIGRDAAAAPDHDRSRTALAFARAAHAIAVTQCPVASGSFGPERKRASPRRSGEDTSGDRIRGGGYF